MITRINTLTNVAYKDDPTIFAWELMNEPRCSSDPSGDSLQVFLFDESPLLLVLSSIHPLLN